MVISMETTHSPTRSTTSSVGEWITPRCESRVDQACLMTITTHTHLPMVNMWQKAILHVWNGFDNKVLSKATFQVRKSWITLAWSDHYWHLLSSSCGMDESPSKNCSEYTERELQGTAFIGNSCAVIYCFYLLVMSGTMVMFNKWKVYETVVKRLMAWLAAVTLLCQLRVVTRAHKRQYDKVLHKSVSYFQSQKKCCITGNFQGWTFLRIGHFEHFCILIFKESPGKWSHTHKQAMNEWMKYPCVCVCARMRVKIWRFQFSWNKVDLWKLIPSKISS